MAKLSLLSLSLSFVFLFHGSIATKQYTQLQNECQIHRLNALEPNDRVQAEAGVTEFWDSNNQQFQCAGVTVIRHRIQARGLILPSYTNTPLLAYIEQGRGIQSVMLPGCPETYQSSQQSQEGHQEGRHGEIQDRHQKIHHFKQGDVLAIPAGAAHWLYNDGEYDLTVVVLLDTTNNQNQLDQSHKRFFLAGTPQYQPQKQSQSYMRGQEQGVHGSNVFKGFDVRMLAEAFNVDRETTEKLQGQDDQRGHIIRIERGLHVIRPPFSREEQEREERQQWGSTNGLEETVCTTRLRENIDEPTRADFYNPQAGRCTTLNSFKFPILRILQLSVERGVLHRVQIVNNQGQTVFDDQLREGQLVVVPQNFVVVKKAQEQGCRWVTFMSNDNAMISNLAGQTSALRGMPIDVLVNAYQISPEQTHRLKYNREEIVMFSPSSRSGARNDAN